MKILRISSYEDPRRDLMLIADSAWRPDRRPYFVPVRDSYCELRAALRISRLGKAIAPRFAPRYYDSINIVWLTLPTDHAQDTPATAAVDDTLVIGGSIPFADLPVRISVGQPEASTCIVKPDSDKISALIADLSREITFKTGDLIILPEVIARFSPVPDTCCRATCNDSPEPIIEFNIK